jgi:Family of unknown function (DUF5677)
MYREATPAERRIAAVGEELLALGLDLAATGTPPEKHLSLVMVIFSRAMSVFEAALWLCRGGLFGQAEIMNRVLFEDMASAHWVIAEPELALQRIQEHEQSEDLLRRDVSAKYPKLFGTEMPESRFEGQRNKLKATFGRYGDKHWTGLGMYDLVEAIEDQWAEGRDRDDLWFFWRIIHRWNSSQVHGGSGAYADAARHLFGEELSRNPGFVGARQVGGPLLSALWLSANLFGLVFDYIDDSRRDEFNALWFQVHARSVDLLEGKSAGE